MLKICLWVLCIIAFQLPVGALERTLDNLSVIDVNIASFHFPPNAHRTENGLISGKAVETIKAFCKIGNMNCDVVFYPTARAYKNMENGSSDVLMTANVAAFERCCTYTKWSYPFVAGLISELPDDELPVNEVALEGHSLVMVRGWQSIYNVYPNLKRLATAGKVELIEANSITSAIKTYSSGRASLLWGANVFDWYFEKLSLERQNRVFKPMVISSAGIWISRKSAHYDDILDRFNLAYRVLKEQGRLDADNFLEPKLMKKVYVDASIPK